MDLETTKGFFNFQLWNQSIISAKEESKEMIWLQRFMEELGKNKEKRRLYNENESSICFSKNLYFHLNTKHIQLK